jgi:hypothetical protein
MSDEYGQVGPDKPDYQGDLDFIAGTLAQGPWKSGSRFAIDVLFTARMAAKHVVLSLMAETVIYGARPPGLSEGGLFVGIDKGKAAWMPLRWLHWSYVTEYLGQSWGDGETDHPFADSLNSILARLGITGPAIAPETEKQWETRYRDAVDASRLKGARM